MGKIPNKTENIDHETALPSCARRGSCSPSGIMLAWLSIVIATKRSLERDRAVAVWPLKVKAHGDQRRC